MMNVIRIRASGTLVLPEPLMDEVISSESAGGSRMLEKCRNSIFTEMQLNTDSRVTFDISGNRLKTLIEISGEDFSNLLVSAFKIICDTALQIMADLKIDKDDFARILSISDIHVLEIRGVQTT
ncbi:MAG: hypothetical protein AAE983_00525 [Thermoplasmataceae archaeon]|jgi:tRNA threonylcarbamoyladenosine modification (KEOPS) complex  Pcc1 subunit